MKNRVSFQSFDPTVLTLFGSLTWRIFLVKQKRFLSGATTIGKILWADFPSFGQYFL